QRHQRRKHQSAPKGEIQGKEARKRRHGLAVAHLTHHSRVKPGRWRQFRFHFERVEPLGNLPHAGHFLAAHLTVAQVRLDIPESRRLQRAGQVLLKAFHHSPVHTILPCPTEITTSQSALCESIGPWAPPASGNLPLSQPVKPPPGRGPGRGAALPSPASAAPETTSL